MPTDYRLMIGFFGFGLDTYPAQFQGGIVDLDAQRSTDRSNGATKPMLKNFIEVRTFHNKKDLARKLKRWEKEHNEDRRICFNRETIQQMT